MAGEVYQKRPRFFANRFCRLLTRAAVAQSIGPESCWLLTVIAHQQDAIQYSRPVTYYNEQLMPLCGFGGRSRLVTARDKAIEAGWLHYDTGGKGKPGTYWVTIPAEYQDTLDGVCDAVDDSICRPDSGRQPDGNRTATGRQPDGNPAPSLPSPSPSPKDMSPPATPEDLGEKPKPPDEPAKPKKPKVDYEPSFEVFWSMVRATAPHKAAKKEESFRRYKDAVRKLQKRTADPHAFLMDRAKAYYKSKEGQTQYANGPAPWLNQGRYDDDPAAWEGNGHATPDPDPTPIIRATTPPPEGYEA